MFFHYGILWSACFRIKASYGTHVFFALWRPMKLLFSHYGIVSNSCFFPLKHKTLIYPQCHPIFWGCLFFQRSRHSVYPDFMQSVRVVDFFCPRYTNFFHIFASFFSTCSEFLWGLCFLIVLSVICKTGLYGSNGWKDESWCNFFNVWRNRRQIMVSKFSIIGTILCSNVWFVWNYTRFGFLKRCKLHSGPYYGQFMTFMQRYASIYDLVFISGFLYGGQPG